MLNYQLGILNENLCYVYSEIQLTVPASNKYIINAKQFIN